MSKAKLFSRSVMIFAAPGAEERARRFADREYRDFEEIEL
jgi:hypothetical protein